MPENPASMADPATLSLVETRNRRGQLLFEYDPATERSVLHLPGGVRLEVAEDGQVELSSPRGIRLRSEGGIEIEGERSVRLSAPSLEMKSREVLLEGEKTELRAEDLKVSCGRLERSVGR